MSQENKDQSQKDDYVPVDQIENQVNLDTENSTENHEEQGEIALIQKSVTTVEDDNLKDQEEALQQEGCEQQVADVSVPCQDVSVPDVSDKNELPPVDIPQSSKQINVAISKDELKHIQKVYEIKSKGGESTQQISQAFCKMLQLKESDTMGTMKKFIDISSQQTSLISVIGTTYQKVMDDKNIQVLIQCYNFKYETVGSLFYLINADTIALIKYLTEIKPMFRDDDFKDLKVPSLSKILLNVPKELKQICYYLSQIKGLKNLQYIQMQQIQSKVYENFDFLRQQLINLVNPPMVMKLLAKKLTGQDYSLCSLEQLSELLVSEHKQLGFMIELLEQYQTKTFDLIKAPSSFANPIAFDSLWPQQDERIAQINQAIQILSYQSPLTVKECGLCIDYIVQNFYTIDNIEMQSLASTRLLKDFGPLIAKFTGKEFSGKFAETVDALNYIMQYLSKERVIPFANCLNIFKSADDLIRQCEKLVKEFDFQTIWDVVWEDHLQVQAYLEAECATNAELLRYLHAAVPSNLQIFSYLDCQNIAEAKPNHYVYLICALSLANQKLAGAQQELLAAPFSYPEVEYLKQIGDEAFKHFGSESLTQLVIKYKILEGNNIKFFKIVAGNVNLNSFSDKAAALAKFFEFSKAEDQSADLDYLNQIFPLLQDMTQLINYVFQMNVEFSWKAVFEDNALILEFLNSKVVYATAIEPYVQIIKLLSLDQPAKNVRIFAFDNCQNVQKNIYFNLIQMTKLTKVKLPMSYKNLKYVLDTVHARCNKLLGNDFKKVVFEMNIFEKHLKFVQEASKVQEFPTFASRFKALEAVYKFVGERCQSDFVELFDYIQTSDNLIAYTEKLHVDSSLLFSTVLHDYKMIKDTLPLIENNIYNDLKSYFDDYDSNKQLFLFKIKGSKKVLTQIQMALQFYNERNDKKIVCPMTYEELKVMEKLIDMVFNKVSSRISKKQLKEKLGSSSASPDFTSVVEAYCSLSNIDLDNNANEKSIVAFTKFDKDVRALALSGRYVADDDVARFYKFQQKQIAFVQAYTLYHNKEFKSDVMKLPLSNARLGLVSRQIEKMFALEQFCEAHSFALNYKPHADTEENRIHYNVSLLKNVGKAAMECAKYLQENQDFLTVKYVDINTIKYNNLLELKEKIMSLLFQEDCQQFFLQYLTLMPANVIGQIIDLLIQLEVGDGSLFSIFNSISDLTQKLQHYQVVLNVQSQDGKEKVKAILTQPYEEVVQLLREDAAKQSMINTANQYLVQQEATQLENQQIQNQVFQQEVVKVEQQNRPNDQAEQLIVQQKQDQQYTQENQQYQQQGYQDFYQNQNYDQQLTCDNVQEDGQQVQGYGNYNDLQYDHTEQNAGYQGYDNTYDNYQ